MIFEGTLMERALVDLGEDAPDWYLWDAICANGDLVEERPMHILHLSTLRAEEKKYLKLFYEIRKWHSVTPSDAIPISAILSKGKAKGHMDYTIKQALRVAWKMGKARRYIAGIFKGGLTESKIEEIIIQHGLTEGVADCARKQAQGKKATGGRSFGVHYILYGENE